MRDVEHSVEPAPGSIRDGEGEYIGDDAATCSYCGRPISGDEDGWYHVDFPVDHEAGE